MNKIFIILLATLLETGCAGYSGVGNLGLNSALINSVGGIFPQKYRQITNSAVKTLRTIEKSVQQQEQEALLQQLIEEQQLEAERRAADNETRLKTEKAGGIGTISVCPDGSSPSGGMCQTRPGYSNSAPSELAPVMPVGGPSAIYGGVCHHVGC
jgi:hypothetical protein